MTSPRHYILLNACCLHTSQLVPLPRISCGRDKDARRGGEGKEMRIYKLKLERHKDTETESAKWKSPIINWV